MFSAKDEESNTALSGASAHTLLVTVANVVFSSSCNKVAKYNQIQRKKKKKGSPKKKTFFFIRRRRGLVPTLTKFVLAFMVSPDFRTIS